MSNSSSASPLPPSDSSSVAGKADAFSVEDCTIGLAGENHPKGRTPSTSFAAKAAKAAASVSSGECLNLFLNSSFGSNCNGNLGTFDFGSVANRRVVNARTASELRPRTIPALQNSDKTHHDSVARSRYLSLAGTSSFARIGKVDARFEKLTCRHLEVPCP